MAVRIAKKLGEVSNHIDNLELEIHDLIVLINGIGLVTPDVYNLAKKQLEGKVDKVLSFIDSLSELKHKMGTLPPKIEPEPVPPIKIPQPVSEPAPQLPPPIPPPVIKKPSIRISAPKVRSRNR